MGARPMARLVEQAVKKPIAKALVFGKLKAGQSVHVEVEGDKLALRFQ